MNRLSLRLVVQTSEELYVICRQPRQGWTNLGSEIVVIRTAGMHRVPRPPWRIFVFRSKLRVCKGRRRVASKGRAGTKTTCLLGELVPSSGAMIGALLKPPCSSMLTMLDFPGGCHPVATLHQGRRDNDRSSDSHASRPPANVTLAVFADSAFNGRAHQPPEQTRLSVTDWCTRGPSETLLSPSKL
jgi:hypothetical protein